MYLKLNNATLMLMRQEMETVTLERYETVGRDAASALVSELEMVLGDASDERPLQTFLANHPSLLAPLASAGKDYWCLDRQRLGSEFVPDFLLASNNSQGMAWCMIELESPVERPLTKAGLPAKKLAEAQKQVRDWRTWLSDNVAYARSELGLKGIDGNCRAYIIIGRRATLDPKQIKEYRALSTSSTTVMTYDRLIDQLK